MIGTRLGPYEITAKLGQGGMGEVYRAADSTLGREVAIKVLPADMALDPDRLARFEREARLLAALNHPNVAHVYGFERAPLPDGSTGHFLAMELIEGEDLAERLRRGPVPLDESVEIARQIAEGLEEAHEHGIVHRDLKPANVKLTPNGKVKVLDFGLAKASAAAAPSSSSADLSQSPTLAHAGTQAGVILGTAPYMSPEQARGKDVDARADIWAFGVVLFEMLTGRPLFAGETVSDVLAGVLKEELPWERLPAATPSRLRALLHRCLERMPRQRLRHIGDARIELEEIASGDEPSPAPASRRVFRERLAWSVAASAAVIALILVLRSADGVGQAPAEPLRLRLSLEPSLGLEQGFDISPDGGHVVFEGLVEDGTQLFVRDLASAQAVPLAGTRGAMWPTFSADGAWIAFQQGNRALMKIARDGGPVTTVTEADFRRSSAAWDADGVIRFTQLTSDEPSSVFEVAASGGDVVARRAAEPETGFAFWPRRVPGAGWLLLTLMDDVARFDTAKLALQDIETGRRQVLLEGAHSGRLASNGPLVFARNGAILATRLDVETQKLDAATHALAEDALDHPELGSPFAISETGTLVYIRDQVLESATLGWVSPGGSATRVEAPSKLSYGDPRISPDGTRALVHSERDLWLLDLVRGTLTRLSFEAGEDETGVWSPDGQWIAWAGNRAGSGRHLFRCRADGSGEIESLWIDPHRHVHLGAWSPDATTILVTADDDETSWDILAFDVESRQVRPLIRTRFAEHSPRLSPDGRWIAYTSDESGDDEVYVQSYPELGRKLQVSVAGGDQAVWSRDGSDLFFRTRTHLVRARLSLHDGIRVSDAVPLFEAHWPVGGDHTRYDVGPDGRVLRSERLAGSVPKELGVVVNAFSLLDAEAR